MLKKLFGFDPAKTTVKTEIIAGITTFLTMSYILAVLFILKFIFIYNPVNA